MEKKDIEEYIKKLQDIDDRINDETNDIGILKEISDVVNNLTKDVQVNMTTLSLNFINLSKNENPFYVKEGDSGFDLRANIESDIVIEVGKTKLIPTGLFFELKKGLEIQVRSRSGLSNNKNVFVLNSPGTIDSMYRGECKIILTNLGDEPFVVKNGDRIAQGVVCPVYGEGSIILNRVDKISETDRGSGGFGHSGMK